MPVAERFRRLRRIGHHKTRVGLRKVHGEEVDLALLTANDPNRFTKIHLRVPRRVHQRHEHLLRTLPAKRHIVLHDREAARIPVLVPKPLKNPLRCVLLLLRPAFVLGQDRINDPDEWTELRLHRRLRPAVARRYRELHHLAHGPRVDPKSTGRSPFAQTLNPNRMSYFRVEFHVLHPSPSPESGKGFLPAGFLLRRNRPIRSLPVRDFCSGAYSHRQSSADLRRHSLGAMVEIRARGSTDEMRLRTGGGP